MKRKLLFAVAALLGMTVSAQNIDVTDQYLDNAGFDTSDDFITTGVCTYDKDVAGNGADGSSLMSVTAWTAGASGDAKAGAAFGFGSDAFLTGTGYRVPSVNSDGNAEGGALGLGGCWDGDAIYTQNLKKPLEAGTYTIEVVAYNANSGNATGFGTQKFGIKTASKEYFKATTWTVQAWTTLSFNITIDEDVDATFYVGGSKVAGGSAASAKIFIDYVKIYKSKSLQDYMDEATEESPADVTSFYLQNAQVTGTDGWTNGRINSGQQYTDAPDNTYLDSWNATFDQKQVVTLKPGKYTLKAATRAEATIAVANIYANVKNGSKNSTAITAVGNQGGELGNGWGWTTVDFLVMEEAEVTIGFYSECGGGKWAGADNFSLLYDRKIKQSDILEAPAQEIINLINNAVIPTANIGEGAFQYSQDNIDLVQDQKDLYEEATAADMVALMQYQYGENAAAALEEYKAGVQQDIDAMNTLNKPEDGQKFAMVLTFDGWTYDNKAMTYIANGRDNAGLYNIQYNSELNLNYAQAFTMTWVEGNKYKMSQIDAEGQVRYICTGVPYGGNTAQIRTTLDAEKALLVEVRATATEGKYNLWNTEANQYIGSQDAGVYTVNSHIDFNIVEAQPGKGDYINILPENKYATLCSPHAVHLMNGDITAVYTVDGVDENGATLVMTELTLEDNTIPANTPVLLYAENGASNQHAGFGTAYAGMDLTKGLLTGVYADTEAPVGSYVLQNHDGVVGFYQVSEEEKPLIWAYKCYLTAPELPDTDNIVPDVKAFTFGEATAIKTVEALTAGKAQIFDMNGRQLQKLQKGINIVNGVKVLVK